MASILLNDKNAKPFSKVVLSLCISNNVWEFHLLHILANVDIIILFTFVHFNRYIVVYIWVLPMNNGEQSSDVYGCFYILFYKVTMQGFFPYLWCCLHSHCLFVCLYIFIYIFYYLLFRDNIFHFVSSIGCLLMPLFLV